MLLWALLLALVMGTGGCSNHMSVEEGAVVGDSLVATPVWYSGFENGWPGHWLEYGPAAPDCGVEGGKEDGSCWTFIGGKQAEADGVRLIEGDSMYKAEVFHSHPEPDKSHRPYPTVHLDQVADDFPDGVPSPVVNRFYFLYQWDQSDAEPGAWHSFVTLTNNTEWDVITMSVNGDGTWEMAHVGPRGGFGDGAGWKKTRAGADYSFPENEWVRVTVYADFRPDHDIMVVWADGNLIGKANGGNVDQTTDYLLRAHWGLYADGEVNNGVQYSDSIQIWALSRALDNFQNEPVSPYEVDPYRRE